MLEYALKQERAKYAKLKYGGDSGQAIVAANALDATRWDKDEFKFKFWDKEKSLEIAWICINFNSLI